MEQIRLRKLESRDKDYMLEWMLEKGTSHYFRFDFNNISEEEIDDFISNSMADSHKHFSIVGNDDKYMGTISLKNIDMKNRNAEYAIILRRSYRGRGVAEEATRLILCYAFMELELKKVYLNVLGDNERAINFYKKMGFSFEGEFKNHIYHEGKYKNLEWYAMMEVKEE